MKSGLLDKKNQRCRIAVAVRGLVQGVGFRPFVYRLARELDLAGWVNNTTEGVTIEVEGREKNLEQFLKRIKGEAPVHSRIDSLRSRLLEPAGTRDFEIHPSEPSASKTALVPPDIATCAECREEILDPGNRRYLYPFTNCTHCGPRYSIMEAVPYDRDHTSMKIFSMCADCREEYDNPGDRRFHAQPNACPHCGPHLELWGTKGNILEKRGEALTTAAREILNGKIIAVKGIGGFHLFCDACREKSVRLLRERKRRDGKPFALMFPSCEMIEKVCNVSEPEKSLLTSGEAPIVLLEKKSNHHGIVDAVAAENPCWGVMLPYSPLHHILMRELPIPVVATSGNLADEPICTDEREAVKRLSGIADFFLVHNRPIVRNVDDSVIRITAGRPFMIRRSRGYAPLPVPVDEDGPAVLAVGGHLKNTVAINVNRHVFLSQHIGDLETQPAYDAFLQTAKSLQGLYGVSPAYVVHDRHPDYASTRFAKETGLPRVEIQHHHAHIVSCMAENRISGPVLGIAWDGTGFGTDQTIWGGEFLKTNLSEFQRVGSIKPFPLPGGEKAIQEPRRTAVGLLSQLDGSLAGFEDSPPVKAFNPGELNIIQRMVSKNLNSPLTSSVGRLFDAVASLLGLCQFNHYEGQAAMSLEFLVRDTAIDDRYEFEITGDQSQLFVFDWTPMVKGIFNDSRSGEKLGMISARFHNTLVAMAIAMAKKAGEEKVVLSGGCFQNTYLTEKLIAGLRKAGFAPYWHQWIPSGDGGIALGQAVIALNQRKMR